ncbi:hypothetical protein VTI74DRAFT_6149 [Chaetomium olivicolor]
MAEAHCRLKALCLTAAEQIVSECESTLGDETITTGLAGCGEPLVHLLQRQASQLLKLCHERQSGMSTGEEERMKSLLFRRLDDLMSTSYAKFYAYVFKELPVCWRQLYTDASILKFALLYMSWAPASTDAREQYDKTADEKELDDMIKTLDLALILAGPPGERRGKQWIDNAFTLLEEVWQASLSPPPCNSTTEPAEERPSKRTKTSKDPDPNSWLDTPSFSSHEPFTPPVNHPIQRAHDISLEEFQTYMNTRENGNLGPLPLIITGLTDTWPARTTHPWRKPSYLLSRTFHGRRLVPVELGRSYVDAGWGQKILPFGDFLTEYITAGSNTSNVEKKKTGYLAQHPLLAQLPSLSRDILIPDLCYTAPPRHPTDPSQDQPELEAPQLNAWLGPPGTITPLHTDPYHNLLAQVVGRKYVRLYSPWTGNDKMRARGKEGGVEMGNTSRVDLGVVEGWDEREPGSGNGHGDGDGDGEGNGRWSEDGKEGKKGGNGRGETEHGWEEGFKKLEYVDCILSEGDVLYIPIGWWHYVRGLSVSFSVSFWWN